MAATTSFGGVASYTLPLPPEGDALLVLADVLAMSWVLLAVPVLVAVVVRRRPQARAVARAGVWLALLVVVALLVGVVLRVWLVPGLWPGSFGNDVGGEGVPATFRPPLGRTLAEAALPVTAALVVGALCVVLRSRPHLPDPTPSAR